MLSYQRVRDEELIDKDDEYLFWIRKSGSKRDIVGIHKKLFNEAGLLKTLSEDEWKDELVRSSFGSS